MSDPGGTKRAAPPGYFEPPVPDYVHEREFNEMLRTSALQNKAESNDIPGDTPKKILSLLEKLPDELLLKICGILYNNSDAPYMAVKQPVLVALSKTSKPLKRVADEVLYKELNLDRSTMILSLAYALANPQLATHVKIISWDRGGNHDCPIFALHKIVRVMPNLQELIYRSPDTRNFNGVVMRLLQNHPSSMTVNQFALLALRKLHVSEVAAFHLPSLFRMSSLEDLFCRVMSGYSSPDDWTGTEKRSGIRHLDIDGGQCLAIVMPQVMLAVKPLKTLTTSQCLLRKNSLEPHRPSLEKLTIECRAWKDLKELGLHRFSKLHTLTIKDFLPGLPLPTNSIFAQLLPDCLDNLSIRIYGKEENARQYFNALMALKEHRSLTSVTVWLAHKLPYFIYPMPYRRLNLSTVTLALAEAGIMVQVKVSGIYPTGGHEWKALPLQNLITYESMPGPEDSDTDSDDEDAGSGLAEYGIDLG